MASETAPLLGSAEAPASDYASVAINGTPPITPTNVGASHSYDADCSAIPVMQSATATTTTTTTTSTSRNTFSIPRWNEHQAVVDDESVRRPLLVKSPRASRMACTERAKVRAAKLTPLILEAHPYLKYDLPDIAPLEPPKPHSTLDESKYEPQPLWVFCCCASSTLV
ncbi:hypothetical protein Pelo_13683 [Pelomyxa schiedti]|nr:hypothetical protein Pelo_13683 [Pelomyxa schiedti]